ncbi:hypothetical protein PMAYCL1PPCAC_30630 [Pristionchus mayeri]|uniref:HMG box domain-containing protein n=1 Tax=Pristionchus mayeri TaxID=1317129 RepID=A0AAN5IDV6_9BILA|nr:hypothetical protein PMAYCL1PPCAC_30630 [Pristionchus mayeri]
MAKAAKAVKKASPKKVAKPVAKTTKASPKKKATRAKKDPNAPKRGASAYMLWLAENRKRITKAGMSVTDVAKAAGVEWGTVKDKSKWEKAAAEDKKRYEKEMASYKSGGSTPKKAAKKTAKK